MILLALWASACVVVLATIITKAVRDGYTRTRLK